MELSTIITFLATYPMAESTFALPFSLWSTEDNSTWNRQGGRVFTRDEQLQCEEDDKLCILSVFNASLKFEAGYQFGVLLNGEARRYDLIHLSGLEVDLVFTLRGSLDQQKI